MAVAASVSNRARRQGTVRGTDKGWAYIVLVAAVGILFMYGGTNKCLGVMLPTLKEQLNVQTWQIGIVFSTKAGIEDAMAIPAALLSRKVTIHYIIAVGSLAVTCGMICATFAKTISQFAVFCICQGVGFGFTVPLVHTAVGYYFDKKYACAHGLSLAGWLLGYMAMAPFTQLLLDVYGWRGTMLVIGGCLSHLVAFSGLLRPKNCKETKSNRHQDNNIVETHEFEMMLNDSPQAFVKGDGRLQQLSVSPECELEPKRVERGKRSGEEIIRDLDQLESRPDDCLNPPVVQEDETNVIERKRTPMRSLIDRVLTSLGGGFRWFAKASDASLLKDFNFIVVLVNFSLVRFLNTALITYLVPHAIDVGFGKYEASLIVAMFSVGGILGTSLSGPVVDRKLITRRRLLFLSASAVSLVLLLDHHLTTLPIAMVGTLVIATGLGASNCMIMVITRRVVGVNRLANSIGWISVTSAPFRVLAGFLSGWIYDQTGSYNRVFVVLGGIAVLTPVVLIVEMVLGRCCQRNRVH